MKGFTSGPAASSDRTSDLVLVPFEQSVPHLKRGFGCIRVDFVEKTESPFNDCYRFSTGGRMGILKLTKKCNEADCWKYKTVLYPDLKHIRPFNESHFIIETFNGRKGVFSLVYLKIVVPCKYDAILSYNDDLCEFSAIDNSKMEVVHYDSKGFYRGAEKVDSNNE